MKTYYDILDVENSCSPAQIKKAFRRRAKELHPDVNPASGVESPVEQMQRLIRAYETLIDPERREDYDRRLLIYRAEYQFDYREYLRGHPMDLELQSKLVFFDLLHRHEDDAVRLYASLRRRPGYRLGDFLDREDFMDCAFLLAEEHECRSEYMEAFELFVETAILELERPYFRHFFAEVVERLRILVCFRMVSALGPDQVIGCIERLITLDLPPKDIAFYLKKAAELYADLGEYQTAASYLDRGLEMDEKLAGTKKLRARLSASYPV